jgi:hypothetical protein
MEIHGPPPIRGSKVGRGPIPNVGHKASFYAYKNKNGMWHGHVQVGTHNFGHVGPLATEAAVLQALNALWTEES